MPSSSSFGWVAPAGPSTPGGASSIGGPSIPVIQATGIAASSLRGILRTSNSTPNTDRRVIWASNLTDVREFSKAGLLATWIYSQP